MLSCKQTRCIKLMNRKLKLMLRVRDFFLAGLLTCFSVAILGYLSIATMFGPWIAPTLVLLLLPIKHFFYGSARAATSLKEIILIQATAAVGGIVAVAIGFSLPMLFFLDQKTFDMLSGNALIFCCGMAAVCLVAGGLGLVLGNFFAARLIDRDKLPFPVSDLTCNMAMSQRGLYDSFCLGVGFLGTLIVCLLRDGLLRFRGFIPPIINFFKVNGCGIALSPMFVALGYTTGFAIVPPLLVGLCSKYYVLPLLNNHSSYLPFALFKPMDATTLLIAFCSGLVLSEVCVGLCRLSLRIAKNIRTKGCVDWIAIRKQTCCAHTQWVAIVFFLVLSCGVLRLAGFTLLEQGFFLVLVVLATYYINLIGGQVGLIQFGRFSTFILIPMILLCNLTSLQMTLVCVFFNICAAAASDLLFDYKTALIANIDRPAMWRLQWIGLAITAAFVGVIFWLLFTHLPLGSSLFLAQRSQAKVLLIQSFSFNGIVVVGGFLYGLFLMLFGLSPTMIFSGLFMPSHTVLALSLGGIIARVWKRTTTSLSLCAGAFSAESLWILLTIPFRT